MDYRRRCPTPNSSSNQRPITNRNSRPEGGSPNAKRDTRNDCPRYTARSTSPAGNRPPTIALLPLACAFRLAAGDLAPDRTQRSEHASLRGLLAVSSFVARSSEGATRRNGGRSTNGTNQTNVRWRRRREKRWVQRRGARTRSYATQTSDASRDQSGPRKTRKNADETKRRSEPRMNTDQHGWKECRAKAPRRKSARHTWRLCVRFFFVLANDN